MIYRSSLTLLVATACMWFAPTLVSFSFGQVDPAAEIRKDWEKLTAAFSAGKADEVVAKFLANGELIDEQGTIYQGQPAIKELLTAFFAKFPGSQMKNEIESIRFIGSIAIQEGRRVTTAKDGSISSVRYTAVLAKTEQGWRIASLRDFGEETAASPGELLKPLAWLIGDWINEGADAQVKITYRWSEDKNFILGEISVTKGDQVVMKSSQRIGWDPLLGTPRSWTFDSDGGFTEATWTQIEDAWMVRSSAVMPDGLTGSAILKISNGEKGRYVMTGTNRIIGNATEDDYQVTVVKLPPAAGK
ncbi:MAG: DUF4440 domain-containing protein [Pirellulaceae bacterium]|nr:DUF4440 domain-containing protein [Pirellulaceae bacterium]